MHQRIPVSTKFAAEGFGGSKFTPIRSMGVTLGPLNLGAGDNGSPSPVPSPSPAPMPDVIVRPTTFVVPPAPLPPEPIYVTEASNDNTRTLVTVAAAIGIFALGAVLF